MSYQKNLVKSVLFLTMIGLSTTSLSWTRTLTFEDGSIGSTTYGTSKGFDDAAGGTFVTDERIFNGSKSAKLTVTGGRTAFGEWGGIVNFPEPLRKGDELWFSVNTFFPSGFNYDSTGEGGHLKFLRAHITTPSGGNRGYNDWYINPEQSTVPHKFICECQHQWFVFGNENDEIQRGQWESYEMYIKFDDIPTDQGGTALVRVWKNGKLLREITGAKTLGSATDISDRAHLFTYWNGAAPKTQHMYIDDLVLTSDTPQYRDDYGNPYTTGSGAAPASKPEPPELTVD